MQSPNGPTRATAQQQREVGPSTAVARAEPNFQGGGYEARKLRPATKALDEIHGQPTKCVIVGSVITSCFLMATPSFAATDDVLFSSDDGNFIVLGGIGLANIKAQEFVYPGSGACTASGWVSKGQKCSQLNWESKGVTLFTVGAVAQINDDWSLKGSVNVGTGGNGHMVDSDWLSRGHDDWSDRSIHPNTELDRYVAGAIEFDRIIYGNETSSFAVGAGFRYTDVKWTAYGGSGLYSSDYGFRDQPVASPDWEKGISYRQEIPVGFVGLSGEQALGDLTISGGIQGGLSFGINDTDDHWLSHKLFHEDMDPAPMIGATVAVNYALTPDASVYLSGSFERVFHKRGDMQINNSPWIKDEAGANFESMSVSFGLKGSF
ncbi:omptin [Sinorhizobium terangae]|uniref:omptin family outer membrane protease n=1 Tax=Sinorhizobium terangae TaxID=110322 RepID=UPI00183D48A2|nr:omptin family outer membrane protease [Sinorhizobium terangae]MBB4189592.1 omptin [Sinorhizobium terangae]